MPKFKVWCKNNKEWEKHDVLMNQDGTLLHLKLGGALLPLNPETHIPVLFTELKDKNGKEIYEGHIVKVFNGNKAIVKYGEYRESEVLEIDDEFYGDRHEVGFHVELIDTGDCSGLDSRTDIWIEIIGHIYENPELLESEAK